MERQFMETAEEYLERIPEFARKKSDLKRVRGFLELLGNPDREFRIFHVAGTNGKGSVCAFLSSVLKEAGISFGAFTSPHLIRIQERFSINGEAVDGAVFEEAFQVVYETVLKWVKQGNPHPTYFEFLFYMGLVMFRQAKVSLLVLETGMGGLKDVTNVAEAPLVSVITSISLDHTGFLGNTQREIAAQKAGIMKAGCPVVYDGNCKEAVQVFEERVRKLGIRSEMVGDVSWEPDGSGTGSRKNQPEGIRSGITAWVPYDGSVHQFRIPFAAPYQAKNAALAIRALELSGLKIPLGTVKSGISRTKWPARMECLSNGIYLDGAHNEDGIRAFLEAACMIQKTMKPKRTIVLFAVSSDKNYRNMMKDIGEKLAPEVCWFAGMESKRAVAAETLCKEAEGLLPEMTRVRFFETVQEALRELFRLRSAGDLTFIAGSLYLAGEIKREFLHD